MIETAEQAHLALDRLVEQASLSISLIDVAALNRYIESVRTLRRAIGRSRA